MKRSRHPIFTSFLHCQIHLILTKLSGILSVTEDMNQSLLKVPQDEEIREATFAINPEKAPGPDCMTSLFYQRFWATVGKDVCAMVWEFFITSDFDERLNATKICLIPKTERPSIMSEFRPISLCNVGYKIILKILSSRLKKNSPQNHL